jgi:hypothetical protein
MAYIAAILCFPISIGYALTHNPSSELSGFLFVVLFGAFWGAIWIHGTWTQLRRLRFSRFWMIPAVLFELVIAWPVPGSSRLVTWIAGTAILIAQIAFACIPPRTEPMTSSRMSESA